MSCFKQVFTEPASSATTRLCRATALACWLQISHVTHTIFAVLSTCIQKENLPSTVVFVFSSVSWLFFFFFFFGSYLAAWAYHLGHCFRVYRGVIRFLCHSFCSTAVSTPQEGKKKETHPKSVLSSLYLENGSPFPWLHSSLTRGVILESSFFAKVGCHLKCKVFYQGRRVSKLRAVF